MKETIWFKVMAHKYGIIKFLVFYKLVVMGGLLGWAAWKYWRKHMEERTQEQRQITF